MNENKSKIQIFDYNGNPVTFSKRESVMINATEMAKSFGKKPAQWFDNPGTHDFIEALAETRGLIPKVQKLTSFNATYLSQRFPNLVRIVKGGMINEVEQGTWMHEDVALEFARWLSPAFAIWCNDRIKELLSVGMTALPSTIEELVDNPDLVISLATQLKQLRAEKTAIPT